MNIIFYIPGMPFNGETIPSGRSLGGSESSGYYLARELAERGHSITIFCNLPNGEGGLQGGVMYMPIGPQSDSVPFGDTFERYARLTPHDVLIGQRVPHLFNAPFASKLNFWWTHDLALRRAQPMVGSQLWNVDGVFTVSEWHRNQVCSVYGIDPMRAHVLRNAIDPALFNRPMSPELKKQGRFLMYTSRPERGLMHLVENGGIMDRLLLKDPSITLKVSGYDNTTEDMAPLYQRLWDRCRALPNVELLGSLGKAELARHMQGAWLHVYPTTFEEVSCITAMEEQAAGTPVLASPVAALPETLGTGAGVEWIRESETENPNLQGFVDAILALRDDPARWDTLHAAALEKSKSYRYSASAETVERVAEDAFRARVNEPRRVFGHLIRHGDIIAARKVYGVPHSMRNELDRDYAFAKSERTLRAHYEEIAEWEDRHGLDHGMGHDAYLMNNRMVAVTNELVKLRPGSVVLDYACGQGHHAELLSRRFPQFGFIGVDISTCSIAKGNAYLKEHSRPNLQLLTLDEFRKEDRIRKFDAVIAGEILEHVAEPGQFADELEAYGKQGALFLVSTPWGTWEYDGQVKGWLGQGRAMAYFRAHLHHFEHDDLRELFGHKPGFRIEVAPAGYSQTQTPMGCFHMSWRIASEPVPSGGIDYERKISHQAPRETLALIVICRPDSQTLGKTLANLAPFADQIVIGIDGGPDARKTQGRTWEIARQHHATAFPIVSPLVQGFAAARNETLEKAETDWVLWIDDDEVIVYPERLMKYLRPSTYDAFAIPQHHYSAEPAGEIKTDHPSRLFRTGKGIKFFGVVHEHPETEINKGPGRACFIGDVAIMHNGYETEAIRRQRFERNLPLMIRERKENPQRALGKMLWIRDLNHLIRFDMERGVGQPQVQRQRAEEAMALWRELVQGTEVRLAIDSLPYYSQCAQMIVGPDAIQYEVGMGAKRQNIGSLNGKGPDIVRGVFASTADIRLLNEALEKSQLAVIEERYF